MEPLGAALSQAAQVASLTGAAAAEQIGEADAALQWASELSAGGWSESGATTLAQAAGVSSEQLTKAITVIAAAGELNAGGLSLATAGGLAQAAGVSSGTLDAVTQASSLAGGMSAFAGGTTGVAQTAELSALSTPADLPTAAAPLAAYADIVSPQPIEMGWAALVEELPDAEVVPFKDDKRFFTLYQPLPVDRRIYLHTLNGTEQLSAPFEVDLLCVSRNFFNELKELNSQRLTVGIAQTDGSERYIDGFVSRFTFAGSNAGWSQYRATLSPWTHFLTLRKNSRIFQKMSIVEILDKVFGEYGPVADYGWLLNRSYRKWDFIVQYDETDFEFVSRLIEKEGWSYYFKWRKGGHQLLITDDTPDRKFCPPLDLYPEIYYNAGNRASQRNSVRDLQAVRTLHPAKVTYDTFDYQAPRGTRLAEVPTRANQGDVPQLEVYTGTPGYAYLNRSEGERYASDEMEGLEARGKYFQGRTDCPDFTIGRTFALLEHEWFKDPEPHRMLLLRVSHYGRNNINPDDTADYDAEFVCQRRFVPYRPERMQPKPVIAGLQTAIVTGPPGEEIWTNRHGCIKVRFHWDRLAPHDDRSSCWIRVSQPWAGEGWGTVAIPRVGQEVVVGFMEGDPDRPLVLGSVYNADQPVPYSLPAGGHMMGFKSNSTPGGGGFSEMVIHDTKGKELVNIHAQKDMVTTVLNNQSTTVKGPQQTIAVTTGKQATTVKKEITITSTDDRIDLTAATSITLTVGQSKLEMKSDGTINLTGVKITSQASSDHVVIGKNLHLNP